jgi:hypothetical protein
VNIRTSQRRRLVVAAALGLVVAALQATPALADAAGTASCVGHEFSSVSPPGSSSEYPDGGPGVVAHVTELAAVLGFKNRGDLMSFIASLHEGSHENCDKALGLG